MDKQANIMVVDDEMGICRNVEKILKKNNYRISHAASAREALEKMAKESYSLLISDIIMPEMNGLELLKLVKKQWPLTKTIMMTAYASTDTAVKAIRMGALDYIPKPFTPGELRKTVEMALEGQLVEADIPEAERESINVIDVDIPFDMDEVAKVTGPGYAEALGRSDMPIVEVKANVPVEGFCELGDMVCDIFRKLGATCKAGVKTSACPQKKAKKRKKASGKKAADVKRLIGIDQPFSYREVARVTGPEYIHHLRDDGIVMPYYEELKENVARLRDSEPEVAQTAVTQAEASKDVEITASMEVEGFCELGDMVCDIFRKLGATCKAGVKTSACPQKKAKKRKAGARKKTIDVSRLVGIDMPFDYNEVAGVTGPDYVNYMEGDGIVQISYEQLKQNYMEKMTEKERTDKAMAEFVAEALMARILVVDDETAVNNNIRKILSKKGYEVEQAFTKEEAIDKINTGRYQLVLLDLKIPGVRGLELLEMIHDKNPKTKVVIITGYASIETAVEAARMGAVDYLPKPFTPTEIRKATETAIRIAA